MIIRLINFSNSVALPEPASPELERSVDEDDRGRGGENGVGDGTVACEGYGSIRKSWNTVVFSLMGRYGSMWHLEDWIR